MQHRHTHKEKAFANKQNSLEPNEIPEIRLLTLKNDNNVV